MTLLSPALLWTLLALIPLAIVYLLKVRPRKKTTTAWFLWEKVFTEKKASSLFNKFRDLWSLLLMALAFAAVAFALAQPEFSDDTRKDLLLVIDQSASMEAMGSDGKSHLDLARKEAAEIIVALNGNQRAAVATLGDTLTYRSHFTSSPRALLESLGQIEVTDFQFSTASLKTLSQSLKSQSQDYRVILLSDGNFPDADETVPESIEVIKVGGEQENIGIVAADLQELPNGALGFYFRLVSSYKENVAADLILRNLDEDAERIIKLIPIQVAPGLNSPEIFEIEEAVSGRWVASIDRVDSMAKDNTVYLTIPEQQPVRVAVGTENRYFFENSILAFQSSTGILELVGESENPDIVIEQRTAEASAPMSIVFTPDGGDSPWWSQLGEPLDAYAPRVLLPEHPALRHTDLGSVPFPAARHLVAPANAVILVESETGVPLVYKVSSKGKSAIIINLDPVQADFYFSTWFPTLVHSTASHLAGRENPVAPIYQPGDTVAIPGFEDGTVTTVVRSDELGEKASSTELATGAISLPSLGFFELENESGKWPLASSLISRSESSLSGAISDTSAPISKGYAPAFWLILIAALVLVVESMFYHRRKVG